MILGDDEIDARSIEIEERCCRCLPCSARRQRPPSDHVGAAVAPEIERSADRASHLQGGARIYGHELDPKLRGLIRRWAAGADAVQGGDRGVHRQRRRSSCRLDDMTRTSKVCSASSCSRSSRATPRASICRSPCSSGRRPFYEASAITRSMSARGRFVAPGGCRAHRCGAVRRAAPRPRTRRRAGSGLCWWLILYVVVGSCDLIGFTIG